MASLEEFDKNMKILVVDDFVSMRQIIKRGLRTLGFENVIEASNGVEALRKLESEPCQLIISDWNMPEMTGLEFLSSVRQDARLKTVPFIMITAEAERSNIIDAAKAGVSNYLVKPFTVESLEQKILVVLAKAYRS